MSRAAANETLSFIDDGGPSPERRAPYLFLTLSAHGPRTPTLRIALDQVDEVAVGRGSELGWDVTREGGVRRVTVRCPDPWQSSAHAVISRGPRGFSARDAGSKNGTLLGGKRIESADLADGALLELGRTFFLYRASAPAALPGVPTPVCGGAESVGGPVPLRLPTLSPAFAARLADLSRIAKTYVPVVLEGETGTGKEVTARALHAASGRTGDLVAVNCGALPPNLIEAELFGVKKGAFSGATEDRPGLVRAASGGTLLLDEIGELPAPAQTALLRVLQEREVVPIGGTKPVSVDVRFVAATHRPLDRMVESGSFRRDLWMRLAGFRMRLPPLRERTEDLGLLTGMFLGALESSTPKLPALSPRVARLLFRYAWPGNIRQLERVLTTACALAGGEAISPEHLPEELQAPESSSSGVRDEDDAGNRAELIALLREHQGNVSAVARAMGKARMQIQRWIKRYGLTPEDYR
ncbi:MAG: sigma 54-interacting transcriptional regulator [Polyangiaceae bacterium]